jgi:putative ABC transport system permease protein
MRDLLREIRFAARGLIAQPGFTITAVVTLALSIGVNVVMLDVLDRLLVRDPPGVRNPEEITRLYFGPEKVGVFPKTDFATFADFQKHLGSHLSAIATYYNEKLSLGRGQTAVQVHVTSCSPDYFSVLGLEPSLGVFPGSKGHAPPEAAVISHALWQQYFGGRHDILGTTLRLGNQAFTIVGIAPKAFAGIDSDTTDVWLPLEMRGEFLFGQNWKANGNFGTYSALDVIARFRPGSLSPRLRNRSDTGVPSSQCDPLSGEGARRGR